MRIGISVLTHAGHSVWENGLGQNIFFLVQSLRALPFVSDIVLLDCGDQARLPEEATVAGFDLRLVAPRDATDLVDVVFEMGGGLDVEWLDYIRALGKKVVFFCCGQPHAGLVEPTIFKKSGYFSRPTRCDEVWILPKDRAFAPMLRALHRCAVEEVPFLWDPVFLERRAKEIEPLGYQFGYLPGKNRKQPRTLRAAVFEPNISVVKCCTIPMLICDAAYRLSPSAIEDVRVLNSTHMKNHPTFSFLAKSLALEEAGKLRLDGRHDFAGYVSQYVDVIVTHQWRNEQNILYLDALHGGYPLVHNSPWLREVGYFYEESDVAAGAQRLIEVANEHDGRHEAYTSRAKAFIAGLAPTAPHNLSSYARRLLALTTGVIRTPNARRAGC